MIGWPRLDANDNRDLFQRIAHAGLDVRQRERAVEAPGYLGIRTVTYELALSLRGEISDNSVVELHVDDGRRVRDIIEGVHPTRPAYKPVARIRNRA